MEERKANDPLSPYFQYLDFINRGSSTSKFTLSAYQSPLLSKPKPPRLESLCLGVVGKHFEDIIDDLSHVVLYFPPHIKMALLAIARRRKILNDKILLALADSMWEILDISGSAISDIGLSELLQICKNLRAVDISQCINLTRKGVSQLLKECNSLEILRWGGCSRSEDTALNSLKLLKPNLKNANKESWEELDDTVVIAQSLRWLVWPKVDKKSMDMLSMECPRIIVNPDHSHPALRGIEVPRGAIQKVPLDNFLVEEINPNAWEIAGFVQSITPPVLIGSTELPLAEKFRLAFVERDARLAPKRAKNARQHQRRAEKELWMSSTSAKAIAFASRGNKSKHNRS